MIEGRWTGTMYLTEPQAGSDLAAVRSRAEPQADGSYKVFGTKIFITYGEHDMAENIVHLVLARVTGAPEGVKGISLFVVPEFIVGADDALDARNDVQCLSIEHKLGIKASPTAVLQFGDAGGAVGHLVGQENRGLETMFIMMNAARYAVGVQGVAVAERAYQMAATCAKERVQGRPVDGSLPGAGPIIRHPDVKRMLLKMRALIDGCRATAITAAATYDTAHAHADPAVRQRAQAFYEFLVPLFKGFATETSVEVTSLGVQVHGGMGFIEETDAAQHHRDARILSIYEGTTAIQANDFVGRKTARDGGAVAKAVACEIEATEAELRACDDTDALAFAERLGAARRALLDAVDFVVTHSRSNPNVAYAGSVPYLMLAGNLVAGWQLGRALLVALNRRTAADDADDAEFMRRKIVVARLYAEHLLTRVPGLRDSIVHGAGAVNALEPQMF
jgi:3-(methylthio)propanoyl-CoA dehydrogenase